MKSEIVIINARANIIRPEFFPVFLFSLIALTHENDMNIIAKRKNSPLLSGIHCPTAALPKPKLTRISETCQQKANTVAEIMAPKLLDILLILFQL